MGRVLSAVVVVIVVLLSTCSSVIKGQNASLLTTYSYIGGQAYVLAFLVSPQLTNVGIIDGYSIQVSNSTLTMRNVSAVNTLYGAFNCTSFYPPIAFYNFFSISFSDCVAPTYDYSTFSATLVVACSPEDYTTDSYVTESGGVVYLNALLYDNSACPRFVYSNGLISAYYTIVSVILFIAVVIASYLLKTRRYSDITLGEALLNWSKFDNPPEATKALLSVETELHAEELFFKRMKALQYLREQFAILKLAALLALFFLSGVHFPYTLIVSDCELQYYSLISLVYPVIYILLTIIALRTDITVNVSSYFSLLYYTLVEQSLYILFIIGSSVFWNNCYGRAQPMLILSIALFFGGFSTYAGIVIFERCYKAHFVTTSSDDKDTCSFVLGYMPPFGLLGFHRYYMEDFFSAVFFSLTGGCYVAGWMIDGMYAELYVKEVHRKDIVRVSLPPQFLEGRKRSLIVAKKLLFTLGFLGAHRFYIGGGGVVFVGITQATLTLCSTYILLKIAMTGEELSEVFILVTSIMFGIVALLWLLDMFQVKSLVEKRNIPISQLEAMEEKKEFFQHVGKQQDDWIISPKDIEFGDCVGSGGSAAVFKGKWSNLEVAIKKLSTIGDEKSIIQEAELHSKFVHANIVRLYGICLEPLCFIMEYMSQGSLMQFLSNPKVEMNETLALNFTKDIAIGLTYLHSMNVLHRDLKSQNILISRTFQAKISDFGEARKHASTMTFQVGTVRWTAPEQLFSNHYTQKADVWSYGVILWEIYQRLGSGKYVLPYTTCSYDYMVMKELENNRYLELTPVEYFPPAVLTLLRAIFIPNHEDRPAFADIVKTLQQ